MRISFNFRNVDRDNSISGTSTATPYIPGLSTYLFEINSVSTPDGVSNVLSSRTTNHDIVNSNTLRSDPSPPTSQAHRQRVLQEALVSFSRSILS